MLARFHFRLSAAKLLFVLCGVCLSVFLIKQAVATPDPFAFDSRLHVVQSGEDLASIAQANGFELADILQLNDLVPTDTLWVGQPLRMPLAQAAGTSLKALSARHQVTKGETLHAIALQYGLHPVELAHLNQMSPTEVLYVGQELRVPSMENWARLLEQGYMKQFPTHVVQASETLASIAQRFGSSEEDLRSFNALHPTDFPQAGDRLMIPPRDTAITFDVDNLHPMGLGQLVRLKERWLEIDLGAQKAVAYEGMTPVRRMDIASGMPETPTVTGLFRIWAKAARQDLSLGNRTTEQYEFLDDVPWVQYFYRDFALHGAYWTFAPGQPGSNGNILLSENDAQWLFQWTTPDKQSGFEAGDGWILGESPRAGTLVFVHE